MLVWFVGVAAGSAGRFGLLGLGGVGGGLWGLLRPLAGLPVGFLLGLRGLGWSGTGDPSRRGGESFREACCTRSEDW